MSSVRLRVSFLSIRSSASARLIGCSSSARPRAMAACVGVACARTHTAHPHHHYHHAAPVHGGRQRGTHRSGPAPAGGVARAGQRLASHACGQSTAPGLDAAVHAAVHAATGGPAPAGVCHSEHGVSAIANGCKLRAAAWLLAPDGACDSPGELHNLRFKAGSAANAAMRWSTNTRTRGARPVRRG
jgi:hypothetical protein